MDPATRQGVAMSTKLKYMPTTGSNAGRRNRKRIEEYLRKNPESTGVEIGKALNLSLPAVYSHLKEISRQTIF